MVSEHLVRHKFSSNLLSYMRGGQECREDVLTAPRGLA